MDNLLMSDFYERPSLVDMTVVIHFPEILRLVSLSILNSSPTSASVTLNSIKKYKEKLPLLQIVLCLWKKILFIEQNRFVEFTKYFIQFTRFQSGLWMILLDRQNFTIHRILLRG